MKKEFSKRLLDLDYAVSIALVAGYIICVILNGIYAKSFIESMVAAGVDVSYITAQQIFDLNGFSVLLGIWIAQLGISSIAYYRMCRSDHKVQLPIKLISELPEDIKQSVDMTQIITSVLNVDDN